MKIAESQVAMAAARSYSQESMAGFAVTEKSESFAELTNKKVSALNRDSYTPSDTHVSGLGLMTPYSYKAQLTPRVASSSLPGLGLSAESELTTIRKSLMQELLRRVGGASSLGSGNMTSLSPYMDLRPGGYMTTSYYAEYEQTSFSAEGQAFTEDGRVIEFNISFEMSRTFIQYTQVRIPDLSSLMMDPLMINVSSAVSEISDQKFYFDLDADGSDDLISAPGKGTGFLAFDKNEDGVINDGSELFGALTGNGFDELAEYDSDGNGWIDENDDIWSKLKVWYKGGDGEDILMSLSEADVGAIFLGYQPTDFSLMGSSFSLNAMVRASGFFLKESGGIGTIQHVDLVSGEAAAEDTAEISEELSGDVFPFGGMQATEAVALNNNGLQTTSTKNTSGEDTQEDVKKTENETDAAKSRRERARERAEESRRKRNEAIERSEEKKRIRKEQLDKLFEDRQIEKEQLDEAWMERVENREEILNDALERSDKMTEALEELAIAV